MAASYSRIEGRRRSTPRQRAASLALAVGLEALLALVLLTLAPKLITPPHEQREPSVFGLSPEPAPEAASRPSKQAARRARSTPKTSAPKRPAVRPTAIPTPAVSLPGIIPMSLASSDIANAPRTAKGDDQAADTGPGASASVYGPGEGPGGAHLYNVAWYREPTDAELAYYMPKGGVPPGAWADISCTMIADYHVENCRSLGESPVGTGLARAMRLASWQFLVRPPRVGNKVLLGSQVRIHFEFGKSGG